MTKKILPNADFGEWLEHDQIPAIFWDKIKAVNLELPLISILHNIRQELFDLYGNKGKHADTFSESRFSPLNVVLDKQLSSCGSISNIIGQTMRALGIPVKFIHGVIESQVKNPHHRHAWLSVYDNKIDEWVEFDPTRPDFSIASDAKILKIYHNWGELEIDFKNGNY